MHIMDIHSLSKLSLKTAKTLFDLKIVPLLMHGLEIPWGCLGENHIKTSEKVHTGYSESLWVSRDTFNSCTCPHKRKSPD
jgi:hypothetical protein